MSAFILRWQSASLIVLMTLGCSSNEASHEAGEPSGTSSGLKLSGIGDSIMQGFDAKACGLPICLDQPKYSFAQGTDSEVNSLRLRFGSPASEFVSVTGAEMILGDDNGPAQARAICKQGVRPNLIVIQLGSNDICSAPSVAELPTVEEFSAAATEMLTTLTSEACGLPDDTSIFLMSIPRLDHLVQVGATKTDVDCSSVWRTLDLCRLVTDGPSAETLAQVAATVQNFNQALVTVRTEVLAAMDPKRQVKIETEYAGESPNSSFGTYEFASEDISSLDCFHPSVVGQRRLSCMAWQSWQGDGDLTDCLE